MASMTGGTPPISPVSTANPNVRRSEILKLFKIVDVDGSGVLDKDELKTLMKTVLGHDSDQTAVDFLWDKLDTDKDGSVTYDEFVKAAEAWIDEGEAHNKHSSAESPVTKRRSWHAQMRQFLQQTDHKDIVLHKDLFAVFEGRGCEEGLTVLHQEAKESLRERIMPRVEAELEDEAAYDARGWKAGLPSSSKARKKKHLQLMCEKYYCVEDQKYRFWEVRISCDFLPFRFHLVLLRLCFIPAFLPVCLSACLLACGFRVLFRTLPQLTINLLCFCNHIGFIEGSLQQPRRRWAETSSWRGCLLPADD